MDICTKWDVLRFELRLPPYVVDLLRSWDLTDRLRSWVFSLYETSAGETLRLLDVILLMNLAMHSVCKVL